MYPGYVACLFRCLVTCLLSGTLNVQSQEVSSCLAAWLRGWGKSREYRRGEEGRGGLHPPMCPPAGGCGVGSSSGRLLASLRTRRHQTTRRYRSLERERPSEQVTTYTIREVTHSPQPRIQRIGKGARIYLLK